MSELRDAIAREIERALMVEGVCDHTEAADAVLALVEEQIASEYLRGKAEKVGARDRVAADAYARALADAQAAIEALPAPRHADYCECECPTADARPEALAVVRRLAEEQQ